MAPATPASESRQRSVAAARGSMAAPPQPPASISRHRPRAAAASRKRRGKVRASTAVVLVAGRGRRRRAALSASSTAVPMTSEPTCDATARRARTTECAAAARRCRVRTPCWPAVMAMRMKRPTASPPTAPAPKEGPKQARTPEPRLSRASSRTHSTHSAPLATNARPLERRKARAVARCACRTRTLPRPWCALRKRWSSR